MKTETLIQRDPKYRSVTVKQLEQLNITPSRDLFEGDWQSSSILNGIDVVRGSRSDILILLKQNSGLSVV